MNTHFRARDRMGRWLITLAKTGQSGIAADERTAYVQEPGQAAYVLPRSSGSVFISTGPTNLGLDGGFSGVAAMTKIKADGSTQSDNVTATSGALTSSAEGGLVYGVD